MLFMLIDHRAKKKPLILIIVRSQSCCYFTGKEKNTVRSNESLDISWCLGSKRGLTWPWFHFLPDTLPHTSTRSADHRSLGVLLGVVLGATVWGRFQESALVHRSFLLSNRVFLLWNGRRLGVDRLTWGDSDRWRRRTPIHPMGSCAQHVISPGLSPALLDTQPSELTNESQAFLLQCLTYTLPLPRALFYTRPFYLPSKLLFTFWTSAWVTISWSFLPSPSPRAN